MNVAGMKALFAEQSGSTTSDCQQERTTGADSTTRAKVTCTEKVDSRSSMISTLLVEMSANKRVVHQRLDTRHEPPMASPLDKPQWTEATMTDAGDCPVAMRPDQAMVVIQPDGSALDPMQALSDMAKCLKDEEAAFAAGAPAGALAAAPDPAKARIVSIRVKRTMACAWVDTGGRDRVMPVYISGLKDRLGKVSFNGHITPIDGQPLHARVDGAFQRELDIVMCGDDLPPKPTGVVEGPTAYGALAQLWATPRVKWAIIPAMERSRLPGSAKEERGRQRTRRPCFSSAAAVQAWITSSGDRQADAIEAAGDKLAEKVGGLHRESER